MKNVLVTGDKGYIGSILVPLLLKSGLKVTGLDVGYFLGDGTKPRHLSHPHYKSINKDIRHVEGKDMKDIDSVIHLSALSNDPMGDLDPELTEDINVQASVRLLELGRKSGVERFLFSSSCSIYGIAKKATVDEESEVNPLTAYAKSKLHVEEHVKKYASPDFCVGILRNATVYGYSPMFRNDLMVNNLVTCALALGKIKVLSDGTPWRPLIDVRDLSRAMLLFLKVLPEKINGEVVNVGFTNSNYRVKDVVALIKNELPDCEVEFTNEHGSDARSYKVNFDKFNKLFPQFTQEWPLQKSIRDLIVQLRKISYTQQDFVSGKYTRLTVLKNLIDSGKVDKKLFYIEHDIS